MMHMMKVSQAERTSESQNENNSFSLCIDSSSGGDDQFLAKLLSRDSVLSCSSSRLYCRECGQVPFEWESRPGKPKCPPVSEADVPPLSPPPALQSTWFSISSDQYEADRAQRQVRLRQVGYGHGCLVKPFKPLLARFKRWVGVLMRHQV